MYVLVFKELIYPSTFAAITILGNSVVVGRRLEDMTRRLDSRFDSFERRLDGVERRLDGMERRLDGIERNLNTLGKELDGLFKKTNSIVGKVDPLIFRQRELEAHQMAVTEKWLTDCSNRRGKIS